MLERPTQKNNIDIDLNVIHLNIQGLSCKIDDIRSYLSGEMHDVLCFTEHHLQSTENVHLDGYICASRFSRITYRRGGVIIYVKPYIQFRNIDLNKFCIEMISEFCSVFLEDHSLLIVAVYRSGSSIDASQFNNNFNELLNYYL